MDQSRLCRHKAFVQETCKQIHLPCSYVPSGIEERTLHNLRDAMYILEQSVVLAEGQSLA